MDTRQYEAAARDTLSSVDDTKKSGINMSALIDFAVAARRIDLLKRDCFYAKKPAEAKRAEPSLLREQLTRLVHESTWAQGNQTAATAIARAEIDQEILHAIVGIATEAGEIIEALLFAVLNREKLDIDNLREELGDLEWYEALGRTAAEKADGSRGRFLLERIWAANVAKLQTRYPDAGRVLGHGDRDLQAEREAVAQVDGANK